MTRLIFLIIFLLTSQVVTSQISYIIPFDEANPNPVDLVLYDDKYIVPAIHFTLEGRATTTFEIENVEGELTTAYYKQDGFSASLHPFAHIGSSVYSFGKDRALATSLRVCRMEDGYLCDTVVAFETNSAFDFPLDAASLGDNLLISYYSGEDNNVGNSGLALIDTSLQVIWDYLYDTEFRQSYVYEMTTGKEGDILTSYNYNRYETIGTYAGAAKTDSVGQQLWRFDGSERLFMGATNVDHTELSDGKIVISYQINKFLQPPFTWYDWFPFPTKLVWLSAEGDSLSEKLLIHEINKEVRMRDLEGGMGDYFFGFGSRVDIDNVERGEITKFSNDGDIIWSRRYEHPDFRSEDVSYEVDYLKEKEDGTIAVLCDITPLGERTQMWLFELNEHGCFGDYTDCGELLSVATEEVAIPDQQRPIIVPNPTSRYVQVSMPYDQSLVSIALHTVHGERLPVTMSDTGQVDLGSAPPGVYLLTLRSAEGLYTERVVRW